MTNNFLKCPRCFTISAEYLGIEEVGLEKEPKRLYYCRNCMRKYYKAIGETPKDLNSS